MMTPTYETVTGLPVRVYTTNAGGRFPVHAAALDYDEELGSYWWIAQWDLKGFYLGHRYQPDPQCPFNLTEKVKEVQGINLYRDYTNEHVISPEKRYRTKEGDPVILYATDAGGRKSIHGANLTLSSLDWSVESWTAEGESDTPIWDLIEEIAQ